MNNDTQNDPSAADFPGRATYSPEDNKLRLYVGRVPRDEYLKLRAEGWTALHKQREAGGGDFVAHWTPERRDTALRYAGIIEDEDMGPAERAADRAERFGGYRDKRADEACGHADKFDAGPAVHGHQSQARAEKAAARHDRIADRAGDAWEKAEYWQRRTAGVISHALHVSSPSVRMGRIKELEAALRKYNEALAERIARRDKWREIATTADAEQQTTLATLWAGCVASRHEFTHPRTGKAASLYSLLTDSVDPITGAQAAVLYLEAFGEIPTAGAWTTHYQMRLAYERQMMAAQGGRAGELEIEVGGTFKGGVIAKVNKSNASGRVVSVCVIVPKVEGWTYQVANVAGTPFALMQLDAERANPAAYKAPTDESRAKLAEFEAAKKAAAAQRKATETPCPLVNPTDADAERLQALWNVQNTRWRSAGETAPTVLRLTQAQYTANSGGYHSRLETVGVCAGGDKSDHNSQTMRTRQLPIAAKVRASWWRVVILTDKPQKPFPASVWHDPRPAMVEECAHEFEALEKAVRLAWLPESGTPERDLLEKASLCGLVYMSSMTQFSYSPAGHEWAKERREAATVNA